ncbi:MAG TPA: hypothetical protein VL481_02290 [Verrucomicrobiae bacterium]|nr:hypothetical protein [Verrucomicrobiae bacterium]
MQQITATMAAITVPMAPIICAQLASSDDFGKTIDAIKVLA